MFQFSPRSYKFLQDPCTKYTGTDCKSLFLPAFIHSVCNGPQNFNSRYHEDGLKNEDDLKIEDDLRNEDDLKNEEDLKN